MARFTGSGGFRLLLHGERVCFGGEPKESARFRVSGGKNIKNTIEVRSSGKSVGHRGGGRIFSAGKKIGSSKAGERLKREHYYDTDDVDDDDDDEDDDEDYDDDEDNEKEDVHDDGLACFRGLVLDISYRPVNVVCWKRAICLEFMEKADVLEYYDQTVSSPRGSFYIPAVLRVPHLLQAMKRRRITHNLSRKSIFLRDSYTCQYCSSHQNCTIDHVLPISRGGEWKWENLAWGRQSG